MNRGLTRLVDRAQRLLSEVLLPGDLAVDLTAGNGRDTLFLSRCVGPTGIVLAFDIQSDALDRSAALLRQAGIVALRHDSEIRPCDLMSGVHLIETGHEEFDRYLPAPPRAVVANLGYLPGGDHRTTTTPATTLAALAKALTALLPGGRIAVVAYVGHPGASEEAAAVSSLFATLPSGDWHVLRLDVANLPHAPFLLVAEKR